MTDGFVSSQNAARRLDVSVKTIYRLRAAGELDWIRVGSRVRISLASLEAYEQRQRQLAGRAPEAVRRLPIPALDAIRAEKASRRAAAEAAAEEAA